MLHGPWKCWNVDSRGIIKSADTRNAVSTMMTGTGPNRSEPVPAWCNVFSPGTLAPVKWSVDGTAHKGRRNTFCVRIVLSEHLDHIVVTRIFGDAERRESLAKEACFDIHVGFVLKQQFDCFDMACS